MQHAQHLDNPPRLALYCCDRGTLLAAALQLDAAVTPIMGNMMSRA